MRRLTDFEKEIVKNLYNNQVDGLEFYELFSEIKFEETILRFEIDLTEEEEKSNKIVEDAYWVSAYYRTADGKSEANLSSKASLIFKRFYDILNLIVLLEANGLVHFASNFNNDKQIFIPPIKPKNIEDALNFEEVYIDGIKYTQVVSNVVTKDKYKIATSKIILPSEAINIYVQNNYRTEEQKLADETLTHNQKTTTISWIGISAAIFGVLVSGLFSALSYCDSKADENKNDLFKNKVLIQVNKMVETIKNIRTDLKQSNHPNINNNK